MKCLIDFGNSRCKWVLVKAGEWIDLKAYAYEFKAPVDAIEKILQLQGILIKIDTKIILEFYRNNSVEA